MYDFIYVCEHVHVIGTWTVGSSAVNVVVGLPLLSDLVGVDKYDHDCNQTDERHQHRCAQSCIDVWDEAPREGTGKIVIVFQCIKKQNVQEKKKRKLKERGWGEPC